MAVGLQQLGARAHVLVPNKDHYGIRDFRDAHEKADVMGIFVGYREANGKKRTEKDKGVPSLAAQLVESHCDAVVATAFTTVPTLKKALKV